MGLSFKRKTVDKLNFAMFVAPAITLIFIFAAIPFAMCIYYSFRKWNGIGKTSTFIGLDNYVRLFTNDSIFKGSFLYTIFYTICVVLLVNALGLLIALLLESNIKGKGFFRASFYIPNIISLIIIGFIWKFIFGRVFQSAYDATKISLFGWSWLGDHNMAVLSSILVSVWQGLGFYMLIYIAGLQSVPKSILEAATIDGAGTIRKFFSIVLPMIIPSIAVCTFYSMSNSLKMFELIFSLTGGGPGTSTTPIALDIYNTAFNNNSFGYGSAKSVVLFLLVLLITIWQVTTLKKREVEA
ncbi:sugar ABC transporter permease [Clostridium sp. 19966]|uniref:carbohydrate ABC transporter permease n=1 Tax=Clostridium sp. 19966 TaxID=2768166 RepID=UPI0028DD6C03|nr:sugar ABC transporter permease [Clostridium sp. 19966]MDT8716886.1 sugar ABC transporter permease [Clostridium sp. 19966]